MQPSSYLDQIERLKKQNKGETDSALKNQNDITIEHLYGEYRKKTKHRPPIHVVAGFVIVLGAVLLLIEAGLLALGKVYGYDSVAKMTGPAAHIFGAVVVVVLLVLGLISPVLFADLFQKVLSGCASVAGAFAKGGADSTPS